MMMRTLAGALLLGLMTVAVQAGNDYPHSAVNGVTCFSCHDLHGGYAKFLKVTNPHPPENIDDTEANNLCWSCHNDVVAPFANPHSSHVINEDYGQWALQCIDCHNPHGQEQFRAYGAESYLGTGIVTGITATSITDAGASWTPGEFAGMMVIPNLNEDVYSYRIINNSTTTLDVSEGNAGTGIDLAKVSAGDAFAITQGRLVKMVIDTPNSGAKVVKFLRATGANSFGDGDAVYDGVCQVCHTQTGHMRNDGLAPDQWHDNVGGAAGAKCTELCHTHAGGFGHGINAHGSACVQCHGHEAGTLYDPDATYPYTPGTEESQGRGTTTPHSTHTESSLGISPASAGDDDQRGPGIYCSTCHDIDRFPYFNSGTDLNSDGKFDLSETDVCDGCHSPGGSYNGVNTVGDSVGAKDNWHNGGVYNPDGSLKAGKEKWCAGCHDESAAVIQSVTAPNVIGDEDGTTFYGVGWGFYKTGHGLATGTYPASGAPAANKGCPDCHDTTAAHIDGEARTYVADSDNYQAGYRLKSVGGGAPMDIPRSGQSADAFPLCFSCHESDPYLVSTELRTNYRDDKGTPDTADDVNAHNTHLMASRPANDWDSDWDGTTGDSRISCPACHNVHGSPSPRMFRHGELISTPGTTDKVPAVDFQYTPTNTFPMLSESTGGMSRFIGPGPGSIAKNGICNMCHNESQGYTRAFSDIYMPEISFVYGVAGSNELIVVFAEPVYSNADATGDLVPADFVLTDADNGRTIASVTHTAGAASATVTLSAPLDVSDDIGTDTLAAASVASIYDASGNPMATTPVTVYGDVVAPALAGQSPANAETDVSLNQSLSFLLLDSGSGVDVNTLSIQLSGTLGYSKTYTIADSGVVSGKGTPGSYKVTIHPDAFFAEGEVITVTVTVDDLAGNALVPPAWSFTAAAGALWESPYGVHDFLQLTGASNLIDGNLATGNAFSPGGPNHYATFQLDPGGDLYDVTHVRFYGGSAITRTWRVYASLDDLTYTQIGAVSVGGAEQWYEVALASTETARYIRVDAWHPGPESADAAFEFEFKGTPVVNNNNAPTLAWTGEVNYVADGANPDSGAGGSNFEFRVNYSDADNEAPALIQLWLDKDASGTYAATEKYNLSLAGGGDGDYANGEVFTTTIAIPYAGVSNMSYRFVASDGVDAATGDPISGAEVVITNNIPTLAWTGEAGYTVDGVNPDTGSEGVSFDFRVKYTDLDETAPSSIQVWIDEDKSGTYEAGEKYDLTEVNAADTILTDGKLYGYSTTLSLVGDGVLSYRFYATDGTDDATGDPLSDSTLTITNNAPVLAWTGEANYVADGANPDSGAGGNNFEFRVSYSDADNEAPAPIQLWLDEDDSGTYEAGEKYDLAMVDGSDTDYTDGKLYSKVLALVYAGDGAINYRFYTSDGGLEDTTSDPATGGQITVTADTNTIPTLAWTGEADYVSDGVSPDADLSGSSFEFRVSYADADNDAPSVIQLWIDENNNGSYEGSEKYDLTAVDGGDTDYTDGKLYSVAIPVSGADGTTLNYRFRAFDGSADASGSPVTGSTLAISDPLEVPAEYASIQAAINAALSGDYVLVSDGTYYENINFSGKAITVQSVNGAAVTTIDANSAGGPVVTAKSGETSASVLKGFTLTHGIGTSGYGGGIYVGAGSALTITDSILSGNTGLTYGGAGYVGGASSLTVMNSTVDGNSGGYGGGFFVDGSSSISLAGSTLSNNSTTAYYGAGLYLRTSSATINNTSITGNNAVKVGGGLYVDRSSVDIENNSTIDGNAGSNGGGLYINGASANVTISDSTVSDNAANVYGGGLHITTGATVTIYDSLISGNSTGSGDGGGLYANSVTVNIYRTVISGNLGRFGGGALFKSTTATVVNTTFSGNKATRGGGVQLYDALASLNMINSTIGGNYASSYGGGLFANGTIVLTNTIIWGNVSPNQNEIWNTVDSANVTNSDIDKDGYDGINGSIRLDPLFVGPIVDPTASTPTTAGDYHLQSGSPAVDSGAATGAPADDIDGNARPVDGPDADADAEYDMGSDEYIP